MHFQSLSALLVAALLTAVPSVGALAEPVTAAYSTSTPTTPASPSTASDAAQYAAREARDAAAAEFQGGSVVWVVSGSAVAVILMLVILVILL